MKSLQLPHLVLRRPFPNIQVNQIAKYVTDQSHQCVIIGIAGTSAFGKSLIASTLCRKLCEQAGNGHIGVIPEDCYYRSQSHLSTEERVKADYDHPSAMDHSLLLEHLQALKHGSAIDLPVYSYVGYTRMKETVTAESKEVIILEGILLLTDACLHDELSFSIFADALLGICLMRHIKCDVSEHGCLMDSMMVQYQKAVCPMSLQFVKSSKQYAGIIVLCGRKSRIAVDILKAKISRLFE